MTEQKQSPDDEKEKKSAGQVEKTEAVKEIGGRKGPEPTRYGDWENGGKCVDF